MDPFEGTLEQAIGEIESLRKVMGEQEQMIQKLHLHVEHASAEATHWRQDADRQAQIGSGLQTALFQLGSGLASKSERVCNVLTPSR